MRSWHRLAVVLGVCLPVPVFAATGLSVPLPATVERIAAGLVPFAEAAKLRESETKRVAAGRIVFTAREESEAKAALAAARQHVRAERRLHDVRRGDIRLAGRGEGRPPRRPVDLPAVEKRSKPHGPPSRSHTDDARAEDSPASTGEAGGTEVPEARPEKPEPKPDRTEPTPTRPEPRPQPEPTPVPEQKPKPQPAPAPAPAPAPGRGEVRPPAPPVPERPPSAPEPPAHPEKPGKQPELPNAPTDESADAPGKGNAGDQAGARPQKPPAREST